MKDVDGYISTICINGKAYKLRCEVVEIYPLVCPKCGGSFNLKYGHGQCPYCDTNYSTQFKLIES
jgi:rubrerythrin